MHHELIKMNASQSQPCFELKIFDLLTKQEKTYIFIHQL